VLAPLFVPGLIFGFGVLVYADAVKATPGWLTLVVAHLSWAFPFSFLAMLIASSRLDPRLLEAGADLGASRLEVLRDIELPLLRPGVVAAFLFGFLLSFNELVRTIFVNGDVTTLPVYVWAAESSHSSTAPVTYALTSLIMGASLVLVSAAYWLLFRRGTRSRLAQNV
jgi:ABC-type spermidine/putrescine transport system permease subunit II